jgi:hypothetical protein
VSTLARRTQLLLDEQRYARLRARAEAQGTSVGAVIREAIDRVLDEDADQARREAAAALLAAEPLPVGEPDELERELDGMLDRGAP